MNAVAPPEHRAHVRLRLVRAGVGDWVGEPELELGTAQVRLAVVLDEGVDAGEHEVVSQVILQGPALHGGADPAVLDAARPPAGRGTTSEPRPGRLALPAAGAAERPGWARAAAGAPRGGRYVRPHKPPSALSTRPALSHKLILGAGFQTILPTSSTRCPLSPT